MERLIHALAAIVVIELVIARPADAGTAYFDPIFGVSISSDIIYASGNTESGPIDLKLDIYRPTDIGQGAVPRLSPAVVIQHGGAWTSGDKGQAFTPATFLAQHGFTVVSAQYRLYGDDPVPGTGSWNGLSFPFYLSIYPGVDVIQSGIEDFAAAMTWTRTNAATYGIDPAKIAAAGGSAGGINALLHTYNSPSVDSAPQAVVAYVATMYGNYNRIDAREPPAFLLNSLTDPLIPYYPDVANMVARMDSVGIYHEPWIHDLGFGVHDVDWDYLLDGETVLERTKDFLAYQLAGVGLVPGDFDRDGDVDGADFVAWQTHFPTASGATLSDGDADNDGDVDGADFVDWQTNFPFTPVPLASPVPEPQTFSMALWATLAFTVCARGLRS